MICLRHLVFNEALQDSPFGISACQVQHLYCFLVDEAIVYLLAPFRARPFGTSWGGGTWELAVIIDSLK